MPVTSMEFNSYLISNAVSRIGEEITDEEIIHEIAKYKIIENEACIIYQQIVFSKWLNKKNGIKQIIRLSPKPKQKK